MMNINECKEELYNLLATKDLTSPEVLNASKKLDKAVVSAMRAMRRKNKKRKEKNVKWRKIP